MRSRSQNSTTRRQSHNGTHHHGKTRLQRKTNRQPPRPIPIGGEPICRQRKRHQPNSHRKHPRSPRYHRPNGPITHTRTPKQNQSPRTLLPNLHHHTTKRLNVPQMPRTNAQRMGRKMLLLPLTILFILLFKSFESLSWYWINIL